MLNFLPCCAVQIGAESSKVPAGAEALDSAVSDQPGSPKKRLSARKETAPKRLSVIEIQEQGLNIGIGLATEKEPPQPSFGDATRQAAEGGGLETSAMDKKRRKSESARGGESARGKARESAQREDDLMPFRRAKSDKRAKSDNKQGSGMQRRGSIDAMEQYITASMELGDSVDDKAASSSTANANTENTQPSVTQDNAVLNMLVVRGPDWKWGEEDGGAGEVGSVLAIDKKRQTLTVAWHSSSHVGTQYRYGKATDLSVAPDEVPTEPDSPTLAAIGRRNTQFMFSTKRQTVIIFDWDDTLFPTTYVRDDMELAWQKPMREQQLDSKEKADITKKLEECEKNVIKLIKQASGLGKVILVTLARSPWVTQSCRNFFPKCGALIEEMKVPVVYAQTGIQVDYDKMQMKSNEEIERFWSGIKGKAIASEVKQFYSQYEGQSWKNIISIGDSDFERLGTQAATADYVRRTGMSSESVGEQEVDGHVFNVRTKTFKLVDQPTIEELTVEVTMLQKWLGFMVNLDGSFDVNLENVEDADSLQRIEKTLQVTKPKKK